MKRALIDTNIYSLAMRGEPDAINRLQRLDEIGFAVVSVGELLAGFRSGSREAKNRSELRIFLESSRVRVLNVDQQTADFYATLFTALKRAGTPIPTNDIWIAAIAQQHDLPVVAQRRHHLVQLVRHGFVDPII